MAIKVNNKNIDHIIYNDKAIDLVSYKASPDVTDLTYRWARPFSVENVAEAYQCALELPSGTPSINERGVLIDTRGGKNVYVGSRILNAPASCVWEPNKEKEKQRTWYEYSNQEERNSSFFTTDLVKIDYTIATAGYAWPYTNLNSLTNSYEPVFYKRILPQDISSRAALVQSTLKSESFGPVATSLIRCSLIPSTTTVMEAANNLETCKVTTHFEKSHLDPIRVANPLALPPEIYWKLWHNSGNQHSWIEYELYNSAINRVETDTQKAYTGGDSCIIDRNYTGETISIPLNSPNKYWLTSGISVDATNSVFPQEAKSSVGPYVDCAGAKNFRSSTLNKRKPQEYSISLSHHIYFPWQIENPQAVDFNLEITRGPISNFFNFNKEASIKYSSSSGATVQTGNVIISSNDKTVTFREVYPLDSWVVPILSYDPGWTSDSKPNTKITITDHTNSDFWITPKPIDYSLPISTDAHCRATCQITRGDISKEFGVLNKTVEVPANTIRKPLDGYYNDSIKVDVTVDKDYLLPTGPLSAKPGTYKLGSPTTPLILNFMTTAVQPMECEVYFDHSEGSIQKYTLKLINNGNVAVSEVKYAFGSMPFGTWHPIPTSVNDTMTLDYKTPYTASTFKIGFKLRDGTVIEKLNIIISETPHVVTPLKVYLDRIEAEQPQFPWTDPTITQAGKIQIEADSDQTNYYDVSDYRLIIYNPNNETITTNVDVLWHLYDAGDSEIDQFSEATQSQTISSHSSKTFYIHANEIENYGYTDGLVAVKTSIEVTCTGQTSGNVYNWELTEAEGPEDSSIETTAG